MAKAVAEAAQNVAGKKAIAVESFSKALQQLPTILADNAGFDSSDLVTRLRKAVYSGLTSSGLDLLTPGGGIADTRGIRRHLVGDGLPRQPPAARTSEVPERGHELVAGRADGRLGRAQSEGHRCS